MNNASFTSSEAAGIPAAGDENEKEEWVGEGA
jgi:hypothetical protein